MPKDLKQLKAKIAKDTEIKKNAALQRIAEKRSAQLQSEQAAKGRNNKGSTLDHLNPFSAWHGREAKQKQNDAKVRVADLIAKGKSKSDAEGLVRLDNLASRQPAEAKILSTATKLPVVKQGMGIIGAPGSAVAKEMLGKVERTKAAFKKGTARGLAQAAGELSPFPSVDRIKDAASGAVGSLKGHATTQDQVGEALGLSKDKAALYGMVAGIALDPAQYATFGTTSQAFKGGRKAEEAALTAEKARIIAKNVDKGKSLEEATQIAEHSTTPLAPRSVAMKTVHGKMIVTSDEVINAGKQLMDKLRGKAAPVEEVKNLHSKYANTSEANTIKTEAARTVNPAKTGKSVSNTIKDDRSIVQDPIDFQIRNVETPTHNTNSIYDTEQPIRPHKDFAEANLPPQELMDSGVRKELERTLEERKNVLATSGEQMPPDLVKRYEQSIRDIQTRLDTTMPGPTRSDQLNKPINPYIKQDAIVNPTNEIIPAELNSKIKNNTTDLTTGKTLSNPPLNGFRENKLPVNTDPQQLSFSDIADTKGTAIDNVEKIAPNQHPLVKADNTGKKVIDFKALDQQVTGAGSEKLFAAIDKLKAASISSPELRGLAEKFSTKVNMPAGLAKVKSRVYNSGLKDLERAVHEFESFMKPLSKDEQALMLRQIEYDGGEMIRNRALDGDPTRSLGEFVDKYNATKKEIWQAEVDAGLRDPKKTPYNPNYVYHSYPVGNDVSAAISFKAERKAQIKDVYGGQVDALPGIQSKKINTLTDAKRPISEGGPGLRPIEHASSNMAARMIKSHSDLAHHFFVQEAVEKLGAQPLTVAGKKAAVDAGLVELKPGSGQYVVPEAKVALDYVDRLRRSPKEASAAGKLLNDFMSSWKLLNTGLKPGAHVTNFMGDMLSSMASGVSSVRPIRDAYNIIREDGKPVNITFKDGTLDRIGLRDNYERTANSGFSVSDYNTVSDNPASKFLRSDGVQKIRGFSEIREEFPRLVTYVDEMRRAAEEGLTIAEASARAEYRVTKYHHDYGDLTPFEQRLKKYAVPYYTFMRKNTPLMLQSIFTRPGLVLAGDKVNKAMEKILGYDVQSTFDKIVPGYAKDWLRFPAQDNGNQLTLQSKTPMAEAIRTAKNPAEALVQGINPVLKLLAENTGGKKTVPSGLPTGSVSDQLGRYLWPVKLGQTLTGKDKTDMDRGAALVRTLTGAGVQTLSGKQKTYLLQKENEKLLKKLKGGK